jgi:hypothetical protein
MIIFEIAKCEIAEIIIFYHFLFTVIAGMPQPAGFYQTIGMGIANVKWLPLFGDNFFYYLFIYCIYLFILLIYNGAQ